MASFDPIKNNAGVSLSNPVGQVTAHKQQQPRARGHAGPERRIVYGRDGAPYVASGKGGERPFLQEMRRRREEGYNPVIMVCIFLLAPLMLIGPVQFAPGFKELKEGKYKRKYFERFVLLATGILFWCLLIVFNLG